MAPERWTGGAGGVPVDGRSDPYALGCVLMELVTGTHPFTARDMYESLGQHLQAAPPAPSSLRPGLPAALDPLVLDLLAKDPRHRPANAREVSARPAAIARDRQPEESVGATPAQRGVPAPPPYPPTVPGTLLESADDPVRALLRRRLTQLVEDAPAPSTPSR
ncbi:hypothetical protein [Streptomyces sp. NBC_01408]|uniref:hypothetical protein n=1 Tax=Streptomyces sp. NBC_01408 TaxID=2903855 RepID=UPI00225686FE|nr:hypothetical protein [Streptomyces sp. NBC_01408]MCX4695331.1 hypothetical protein [Streptomyces sp. NBC_01408]